MTITFTNNVTDMGENDVLTHIKITEDGNAFTDFMPAMDQAPFPTSTVKLAPKTVWAAGKTYVVTVAADAADALGKKLGAPVVMSFHMSAN